MSARVLLVTGSRALSYTPAAEAWARDKLRAALDWWEPTLLVHGGCPRSPDVWAHGLAECAVRVYFAGGRVEDHAARGASASVGTWLTPGDVAHPLMRNVRMVEAISMLRFESAEVLVVGLTAPWARTHGTEHTLARADDYGLRTAIRACPAELGPGVRRC